MQRKVFVVEGPDGSGKSYLIDKLEERLQTRANHDGGPPRTVEELSDRVFITPKHHTLLDRWSAISEQIYTPVFGRPEMMSKEELNAAIDYVRPIIIYCRPPIHVLMKNRKCLLVDKEHKDKGHCQDVHNKFYQIVRAYDNLMNDLIINRGHIVSIYDYTGVNINEC